MVNSVIANRLEIRPSAELRKALDRWRIEQEPPLSRVEAARVLLEAKLKECGYCAHQQKPD